MLFLKVETNVASVFTTDFTAVDAVVVSLLSLYNKAVLRVTWYGVNAAIVWTPNCFVLQVLQHFFVFYNGF